VRQWFALRPERRLCLCRRRAVLKWNKFIALERAALHLISICSVFMRVAAHSHSLHPSAHTRNVPTTRLAAVSTFRTSGPSEQKTHAPHPHKVVHLVAVQLGQLLTAIPLTTICPQHDRKC
jgi:hypothetical protein